MEKDEISKYKTKNFKKELEKLDKIYSKKQDRIMILFAMITAHIFILPNDILDKFTFLVPYTEFMKETFSMVYQISIRVTNFPQSGALWAANMMVFTILFMIPTGYTTYIRQYEYIFMNYKQLFIRSLLMVFITIFFLFCIDSLSRGNIFDTQLRGAPNLNAINNKFGLFFKAGIFYFALMVGISSLIANVVRIAYVVLKKINLKFKILSNEK